MKKFLLVLFVLCFTTTSSLAMGTGFSGADNANIIVGPLTINGTDTDTDEFIDLNPQLIGNRRWIFIDPRTQGFGGSTGALGISLAHKTLRKIRSKKKGVLKISNGRKKAGKNSAFIKIDHRVFGTVASGTIKTVNQLDSLDPIRGKIKFKRVRRMINLSEARDDAYEFTIKAKVKNLRVIRQGETGNETEILESAIIEGSFIVTFNESFFIKF